MIQKKTDQVFLDANVLFSAAYRSDSGIRRLWRRERCALMTSGFAREEAWRNLEPGRRRDRLARLMEDVALVSEAPDREETKTWGLPDKDVPILAAAVRAHATHLLTGDLNHFGHLMGSFVEGVLILRPADYLKG